MIADDLVEAVAAGIASEVMEGAPFGMAMIAQGYHIIVEAIIHPHNAVAVKALRDMAGVTAVSHRVEPALERLKEDTAAAVEFLGVTPTDREAIVKRLEQAGEDDPLKSQIKDAIRGEVEEFVTAKIKDLPVEGKPN
jgi:hypothetical protein